MAVSAPRTRYKVQPDSSSRLHGDYHTRAVPSCAVASMRYASTISRSARRRGQKDELPFTSKRIGLCMLSACRPANRSL